MPGLMFSVKRTYCRRCILLIAILVVGGILSCQRLIGKETPTVYLKARPWPAADRLFHQDPRWLGADDAHSVDLGKGRVLWLFGDTFIEATGSGDRARSDMIRNSIGIQAGSDPSSAIMTFFWNQTGTHPPASFFPESGQTWFWPGDGIRIGRQLLIFLTVIEPFANDLGFVMAGWRAVVVDNPDLPPGDWQAVDVLKTRGKFSLVLGTGGLLRHAGCIYAYGTNPRGNQTYLARWREEQAGEGDLSDPEWWCGAGLGWKRESLMDGEPAVLFADAQAEFGVHFEPRINRFVQIQTTGFGAGSLGWRIAPRPEGPWGPLTDFYCPKEASIPGILIYAAKSHPFLTGADLVITYATNHADPERLNDYPGLYYPRMLQCWFESAGGAE
ncbi:MAG: DUF4185 domain-containing protein [Deltaproteobacteria bacterium]|nr:DUF4185 domain-containing protein [Deltaproteobacteria bacterium]